MKNRVPIAWAILAVRACSSCPAGLSARNSPRSFGAKRGKPILQQIQRLRSLPDDVRASTTAQLALQIRQLPAGASKLALANGLANLSTEGDFGRDTLQEVTTTARSVPAGISGAGNERPARRAIRRTGPACALRAHASIFGFTRVCRGNGAARSRRPSSPAGRISLRDLQGRDWTLSDLRGKVVVVNFWATWCPPCRKEMPDLESLYLRFKGQGLVVLAISDEDGDKVSGFLSERNVTYPILLDPGRKVNDLYRVEGIPKTFIYNRDGKLVAQSIDMRTQKQFLEMLAEAGLQ